MRIEKNVIVELEDTDEPELIVPKNVIGFSLDIDSVTFYMPNIEKITVEEGNDRYVVKSGCLINTLTKTLFMAVDNAVIPADGSVEKIGAYAFNMRSVKELVIPDGVREIGYMSFASLNVNDEEAFPITAVLPASVEKIASRAFALNPELTLDVSQNANYRIEGGCFIEAATGMFIGAFGKHITVPDCVTVLPDFAFIMESCEAVRLPQGITKIGKDAFFGCGSRDEAGKLLVPLIVSAPKNSYAYRYLVRNKISHKAI